MANQPRDLAAAGQSRFQFSLRGLMALVFGVAVGVSVTRMERWTWGEALLTAATAWIVLGLIVQSRDLWATFHGRRDLPADVRRGWRFAVFWRLGIVCLLVAHYVVKSLLYQQLISLPEREGDFLPPLVLAVVSIRK